MATTPLSNKSEQIIPETIEKCMVADSEQEPKVSEMRDMEDIYASRPACLKIRGKPASIYACGEALYL
jgi:hypothetical protein